MHVGQVILVLYEEFVIETFDCFIKDAYHFSWKVDELVVKIPVKLFDVFSEDDKDCALINIYFTELCVINLFREHVSIEVTGDLKIHHQGLQTHLGLSG